MMYAKLISVHLLIHLGYNVLFQDVDVIWYKHPLFSGAFTDPTSHLIDFDMLFQDDGGRAREYAPYSGNSGFYYVRNNERTRYFFTQFLYNGALIFQLRSHQQVMNTLMSEYSSLFGLKVKVLNLYDFPGGQCYHHRKSFMTSVVKKERVPFIFHMNWTLNKDSKIRFMKQMGMWFLEERCTENILGEIPNNVTISLANTCCTNDAIISCYYRDKPSVIDCSESDALDEGEPSFWEGVEH